MLSTTAQLLPGTSRRFFDWASTSPLLLPSSAARARFLAASDACDDPPAFLRSRTDELGGLRTVLARLVNARLGDSVILGRSAAELLSLVAAGLSTSERDVVVLAEPNHPVADLCWLGAARRRQMRVVSVPHDSSQRADLGQLRDAVDARCLAVCVTHVTHLHGGVQPIAEIANIAHRAGALLIVDGAQAVGRVPVDLAELDCDAYIGVGRKALLAPMGTAFLVARGDLLERVDPAVWSTRSAAIAHGPRPSAQPRQLPARLEGSLPDLSALAGLRTSVEVLLDIGIGAIQEHVQEVLPTLLEGLGRQGLRQVTPSANIVRNVGIVTFAAPGAVDSLYLQSGLRKMGYVVAADASTLRFSIHMANVVSDVATLAEEVNRIASSADI